MTSFSFSDFGLVGSYLKAIKVDTKVMKGIYTQICLNTKLALIIKCWKKDLLHKGKLVSREKKTWQEKYSLKMSN